MNTLVVIVNYRVPHLTIDALASLEPEMDALPGSRVVVVDNASGDGSDLKIQAAIDEGGWGEWAHFIPAPDNRGFAAGNNVGIRHGMEWFGGDGPDSVLLLNPDTVVRPGGVRVLVEFLESHPEVGIAGSRLEDPDGTPQASQFRFPGAINQFEGYFAFGPLTRLLERYTSAPPIRDEAHEIEWVSGASMLVRREVIDDIGLLDDDYFLYFEETDFCLRAQRAGWRIWYVPDSHVVHLVGQSSGVTVRHQDRPRRPVYWFDSRLRYYLKNYGALKTMWIDVVSWVGLLLGKVRCVVLRRPPLEPPHFLRDMIANSVFVRGTKVPVGKPPAPAKKPTPTAVG